MKAFTLLATLLMACGAPSPDPGPLGRAAQATHVCNTVQTTCTSDLDCQAHAGACAVAKCGPESGGVRRCQVCYEHAGTVCRAAAGICDLEETCSGTSVACPENRFKTGVCRPAAGDCDVPETCTGTSAACPVDRFKLAGLLCRGTAGVCDKPEFCNGTSAQCPADQGIVGIVCREAMGPCDEAETCTPTFFPNCPPNRYKSSTTLCRGAAAPCDEPDYCTGSSANCLDKVKAEGTPCRGASGPCDVADSCTGTSKLCPNEYKPAGTLCRTAQGPCDVADVCSGSSAPCPDQFKPVGTVCREASGDCDLQDRCSGTSAVCQDVRRPRGYVCRPAAGPCDVAEECSGLLKTCPEDEVLPEGTICGAQCESAIVRDLSCDASGGCTVLGTPARCYPYVCASTSACYTSCTSDAECSERGWCRLDDQTCQSKRFRGQPCTADNQCDTEHCADGVCCNEACEGACRACTRAKKGVGQDGFCGPVAAGSDPDEECTPDGSACGADGTCDGAGACREATPAGAACGEVSCAGGIVTTPVCDGAGACQGQQTSCEPYACQDGRSCATSCATSADCTGGTGCVEGTCQASRPLGTECGGDYHCASGHCVDGVCCDEKCDGLCRACTAVAKGSGSDGTCGPVAAGQDPRGDCPDEGAPSCGRDGMCDGSGACRLYPPGTSCGDPLCDGSLLREQACSEEGACAPAAAATDCAPYACAAGACATQCAGEADCVAGSWCDAGTCRAQGAAGQVCTKGRQCQSGTCSCGRCCEGAGCSPEAGACPDDGGVTVVPDAGTTTPPSLDGGPGPRIGGGGCAELPGTPGAGGLGLLLLLLAGWLLRGRTRSVRR